MVKRGRWWLNGGGVEITSIGRAGRGRRGLSYIGKKRRGPQGRSLSVEAFAPCVERGRAPATPGVSAGGTFPWAYESCRWGPRKVVFEGERGTD